MKYTVLISNFDKSHKLCKRPRVLELNSFFAIISIFALSVTATFGALFEPSTDALKSVEVAMVVIRSFHFGLSQKLSYS